jgi:glycosyltransferase involved in cell wall biosynthesis
MREKLRLSDLNVLYICLSDEWNTIERRCLADACYFRNIGGSAFILCQEKTILDKEAEKEALPRIYFSSDLLSWRGYFNFYFQVYHILQREQIDIIHTYNFQTLLPIGFALRGIPRIPLIFTFNENFSINKRLFMDKLFLSRTDAVFTFSSTIRELALEVLPLNQRKIYVTGAGIESPLKTTRRNNNQEIKKILIFIGRKEKELRYVKLFVDSVLPLLYQLNISAAAKKLSFILATDISWLDHPLYDQLKRMVLERHLELFFRFETRAVSSSSFLDCDIFLGLPIKELFTDLDFYALAGQVPVLLPRTSPRQQVVKQGEFGETYHPDDGRELKDKIIQLLKGGTTYLDHLESAEAVIRDSHHFDHYSETLYFHYEKLYSQRLRYSQKKKKI